MPSWANFQLRSRDETLSHLVESIYKAANSDMPVLAAIGVRTAFDRLSELLDIDPNISFARKLQELRNEGHISDVQKNLLEVLVDAGSAAAHRGWKPRNDHLNTMIEVMTGLIRDTFITPTQVNRIRQSVPPRE